MAEADASGSCTVTRSKSTLIKLKVDLDENSDDSDDESDEEFFDKEKIKKKFMSAWLNVKYGKLFFLK